MNKGRDKFRRFARGKHRKGKIMRLAMIFLPLLLLFSMCSAFMGHGGHRGHRHGRSGAFHQTQHGEFNRDGKGCRGHHCGMEENSSTTAAAVPAATVQPNVPENTGFDELKIIQSALDRAVVGEDITVQQRNLIMAQEAQRLTEMEDQKSEEETVAPAPAAGNNNENSSNQAGAQPQTGRESRNHHRRRGFSPIGFLIGGLFKLGLLFFLLSFIAKRFGFRPWRQPLGFRRWQQAYADAWGTPVSEETPVTPEEDEDDDIARELEREEQKQQAQQAQQVQQAQQKKAKEDQTAQSEKDDESTDSSDKNQTDDKNAA